MRNVLICLYVSAAFIFPISSASAEQNAGYDYMICVRTAAERLVPSGDAPQDVARAAVYLCSVEELAAFNLDPAKASQLRETALFYGAAQAVAARLCRLARDCGLAPLPPKIE